MRNASLLSFLALSAFGQSQFDYNTQLKNQPLVLSDTTFFQACAAAGTTKTLIAALLSFTDRLSHSSVLVQVGNPPTVFGLRRVCQEGSL